jgi:hypothetical protein
VEPGVPRRGARGRVTVLELGGLVERDSRPDQVVRIMRQPGQRERGQRGPQVLPGRQDPRRQGPGRAGRDPAARLFLRLQHERTRGR